MHQQLLPTGQVTYFPMSTYVGDGRIRTLGGQDVDVAARKVVDSTFVGITVPSMRRPPYAVAAGVDAIPPNDLPRYRPGIATSSWVRARPRWTPACGCCGTASHPNG